MRSLSYLKYPHGVKSLDGLFCLAGLSRTMILQLLSQLPLLVRVIKTILYIFPFIESLLWGIRLNALGISFKVLGI